MHGSNSERQLWHFIPVKPGVEANFRRWNIALISMLTLIVLGVFMIAVVPGTANSPSPANMVPLKIDTNPSPVNLMEFKNGYASVIDPALPAVVSISSTKVVKEPEGAQEFFFGDPFFRQFFGDQPNSQLFTPDPQREHGLGSGVIVNSDGYILTNNHVVSGASDIEVFTQDEKKFRAKLVGTDPRTDVAVLKIDATHLPALTLGHSSRLKVGHSIERYEDFIQTDAAINPGNSGGALLDLHGD